VSCDRALTLLSALAAVACAASPAAAADPGSPSYNAGKQAIDDQVNVHHVQFPADTDWQAYCEESLRGVLKTGQVLRVDSAPDFIAGCQDEGHALLPSQ
jgi:hypothetical protein